MFKIVWIDFFYQIIFLFSPTLYKKLHKSFRALVYFFGLGILFQFSSVIAWSNSYASHLRCTGSGLILICGFDKNRCWNTMIPWYNQINAHTFIHYLKITSVNNTSLSSVLQKKKKMLADKWKPKNRKQFRIL